MRKGNKRMSTGICTKYNWMEVISDAAIIVDMNYEHIIHANKLFMGTFDFEDGDSIQSLTSCIEDESQENLVYASLNFFEQFEETITCPNICIKDKWGEHRLYDLRIKCVDDEKKLICVIFSNCAKEIESLRNKNKYYDVIYTLSFSYPFRLDVQKREIEFIGPIHDHFVVNSKMVDYPNEVISSGVLHKDDIDIFRNLVQKMYQGEPPMDVFRAYDPDGRILWYKVEYVVHRNELGVPIEIIGEFLNIQKTVELESQLQKDGLTGCYSKTYFRDLVEKTLLESKSNQKHALLIIDIDNFKGVNDYLGHQFGDDVLKEVGGKLQKIFRSSDYVGRIGGDEFMVFMSNIDANQIVEKRVTEILEQIRSTYQDESNKVQISASIGIGMFPIDGNDYESLYKKADIALYETKNQGKDGVNFYCNDMEKEIANRVTPFERSRRTTTQHLDNELIQDVFYLLFDAVEFNIAVERVLRRLGNYFEVSRCYILEVDENNLLNNTFEWCKQGIDSHKEDLQGIVEESYVHLFNMANEEGVIYCNDMSMFEHHSLSSFYTSDITSCLCSLVKSNGKVTTLVGFDECYIAKVWSIEEINTLMYVSKMLAQFLKHTQMIEQTKTIAEDRLKVLDAINAYVYIIDIESFEIKHFNLGLKKRLPTIEKNDVCYEIFRNQTERCQFCPIVKMQREGTLQDRSVIPSIDKNKKALINTVIVDGFEKKSCALCSFSEVDTDFLSVVNNFACGIAICKNDPWSTIVEANDAFFAITGYTRLEMREHFNDRFASIVVDDVDEILKKILDVTVRDDNVIDYEYRIQKKDGEIAYIHDLAIYDKENDIFQVVIMDITDKKKIIASMDIK